MPRVTPMILGCLCGTAVAVRITPRSRYPASRDMAPAAARHGMSERT